MNEVGKISTIIQNHVEGLPILEVKSLFNAPQILLVGLPFPSKNYKGTNTQLDSFLLAV